ncbi:DUF3046 domain-containing protein [Microbacterium sp. P02]|uniref:DUF3046 domain-containing protein n=1 Tax=Microbacterium sp. P02 TaxID=3366260 RepID=UPI00366BE319
MRRSEFLRAVDEQFGGSAAALVNDLVLGGVGGLTPAQALRDGVPPREIWFALCDEADVPVTQRYGVGRLDPRQK